MIKTNVKGLIKGKAHPKNIASCLSERTGRSYSTQDLRNIIKSIDEVLIGIEENGDMVRYIKNSVSRAV